MSIHPTLQNVINLHTLTLQAIAAPAKLPVPIRKTGQPGLFRVLPAGWAEVTHWPLPGADEFGAECEHWSGPILFEEESQIALEIGGEQMVWDKSDRRITVKYGSGVAA